MTEGIKGEIRFPHALPCVRNDSGKKVMEQNKLVVFGSKEVAKGSNLLLTHVRKRETGYRSSPV
jgi:hypothetical protein